MPVRPLLGHPAATLPDGTLIAGDIHLGLEDALRHKGARVPGVDASTLQHLRSLIDDHAPPEIILLGDVKENLTADPAEERAVRPLDEIAENGTPVTITPGNHDGLLHTILHHCTIAPMSGVVRDDVGLLHGHATPSPDVLACPEIVACHIHPKVRLRDEVDDNHTERVWVRVPHDNGHLVLMPAFNEHVGGYPLNGRDVRILGPLSTSLSGLDLGAGRCFTLDGLDLGRLHDLRW